MDDLGSVGEYGYCVFILCCFSSLFSLAYLCLCKDRITSIVIQEHILLQIMLEILRVRMCIRKFLGVLKMYLEP